MDQKKAIGCGSRGLILGIVLFAGLVVGFIFLLRGCLSQWDSFGVAGWPGITDDQKTLVFVKSYSKTNSYSNKNGIVSKSYSTTYYIEKVDLATGQVVKKEKLMAQRKIKKGVLECFGGYKNRLWVFANFLRAYDMNTLEQVVKLEDIETKNPQLKGKMPAESQYYDAHINLGYITVTAQDGDKYNIVLDDLHAELVDENADKFEYFNQDIKKQQELLEARIDSLNEAYRNEKDYRKYDAMNEQQEIFYTMRDSLNGVEQAARDVFEAQRDLKRKLEDFDGFFSSDTEDWTVMQDSLGGYGYLLSKDQPTNDQFEPLDGSSMGSETDKVTLYKLTLETNKKSTSHYDRLQVTKTEGCKDRYLQGAMMVDYTTARAYRLKNPDGFIIFSRDIIGNKGKLLVTRIDVNGKQLWQTNAQMSFKIMFTTATNQYLVICGIIDHDKAPSFSVADALRIIDLKTGALVPVKF